MQNVPPYIFDRRVLNMPMILFGYIFLILFKWSKFVWEAKLHIHEISGINWILHCVKSVQIRSFFGSVFSRIQTEYGLRIWTLFTQCCLENCFKKISDPILILKFIISKSLYLDSKSFSFYFLSLNIMISICFCEFSITCIDCRYFCNTFY